MKHESTFESAWADGEHLLDLRTGSWRYKRPAIQSGLCVKCGSCEIFCPTGSISLLDDDPVVDLRFCKGCGICTEVCPSKSIKMKKEESHLERSDHNV